jgi:hypothetical protein
MPRRHFIALLFAVFTLAACAKKSTAPDPQLSTRGTVEVTARLLEVPEGAIFERDLYDYAAILKYEVTVVHRGALAKGAVIYIGHYNPWKPRAEAADKKVQDIGGTLREFRAGETHRMALETPMDEHYLGGIVDKYFGKHDSPAFWAVWTNPAD